MMVINVLDLILSDCHTIWEGEFFIVIPTVYHLISNKKTSVKNIDNLEVSDHYVTVVEGQNTMWIIQVNQHPSYKLIDGHMCIHRKKKIIS